MTSTAEFFFPNVKVIFLNLVVLIDYPVVPILKIISMFNKLFMSCSFCFASGEHGGVEN